MSDQMCRDFASLARTMHSLSIRCEHMAVEFPKHAEQLLAEAGYKRRASWRYLEFARDEKEAAEEARLRNRARAA